MTSGRNANDRDRKFLAKVKAATLPQLLRMHANATEQWKRVAIERAIRRLVEVEEKS